MKKGDRSMNCEHEYCVFEFLQSQRDASRVSEQICEANCKQGVSPHVDSAMFDQRAGR